MVKLQKHKAYTFKTKDGKEIEHYKFTVVIPEKNMQALQWRDGDELDCAVKGNALILKQKQRGSNE